MSLFERIQNKRQNLTEVSDDFTSKQRKDNLNMLNKMFGSTERSKKTARDIKNQRQKNKNPSSRPSDNTPKRGSTTIRTSRQLDLFTGKPEAPKEVPVKTTYKPRVKKKVVSSDPTIPGIDDESTSSKKIKNRFFTDKSDGDTLKTKSTGDEGQFRRNANRTVVNRQLKKTIPGKSKKVTVGALDARDTSIDKLDDVIIKPKKGDAAKTSRKIKKLQKDLTKPKPGEVTGAKKIVKKFTSGVDQREVSQKAKEFTKKINIKNRKVTTDGYGAKKRRKGQPTYKQVAQDINKRNPTYTGKSGGQLPVKKSKLKTLDTYSKMSTSAVKRDIQKKFGETKPKTTTYADLATKRSKALDKIRSIKKTLPKSTRATVDLTKPLAQVKTTGARAFYKPAIKSVPKTFRPLARPAIKNVSKLRGLMRGTSGRTKAVVATASAVASIPLVQRLLKPKNIAKTGSVVAGGEALRRGLTPGSGKPEKIKPVDVKLSLSSTNKK